MKNRKSLDFFADMAKKNPDEKSVKITKVSDFTKMDADFIMKYANKNTHILDLASGSGLIINRIYNNVGHITAVEAFMEFTKFIVQTKKIELINEDISNFKTDKVFDLITMFGIAQYFNETEITNIYKRYYKNLDENGNIIIKNQFGVHEDVTVSGYSDELKTNYYSQYRHIDKEVNLLKEVGYKNIEVIDIYPPECSRWDNTHFYAIVGSI